MVVLGRRMAVLFFLIFLVIIGVSSILYQFHPFLFVMFGLFVGVATVTSDSWPHYKNFESVTEWLKYRVKVFLVIYTLIGFLYLMFDLSPNLEKSVFIGITSFIVVLVQYVRDGRKNVADTFFALTLKDLPNEPGYAMTYVVYNLKLREVYKIFAGSNEIIVNNKSVEHNEPAWEIIRTDPSLIELL